MSIKLTKTIDGKKVELDLIFLNGKSVVRDSNLKELEKKGVTKSVLKKAGFDVEADELKKV